MYHQTCRLYEKAEIKKRSIKVNANQSEPKIRLETKPLLKNP